MVLTGLADRERNMKRRKRESHVQEGGEASEKSPRGDEKSNGTFHESSGKLQTIVKVTLTGQNYS